MTIGEHIARKGKGFGWVTAVVRWSAFAPDVPFIEVITANVEIV